MQNIINELKLLDRGRKVLLLFFLCLCLGLGNILQAQSHRTDTLQSVSPRLLLPSTALDLEYEPAPSLARRPKNLITHFVYDEKSNIYLLYTFLNGQKFGIPIPYTADEYLMYLSERMDKKGFNALNNPEELKNQERQKKRFNLLNMEFGLGPAERVFGPGGVKLRLHGSAELKAGVKHNFSDNPALAERARNNTFFDFDEQIQAGVNASVGDKLKFNLNYNTQSTFDFDSKKLKLAFEGKEDDIFKLVEAGNVSMQPKNSLISGGVSLFGLHTKMQFGRLMVDLLLSQQRSQRKSVQTKGGANTETFEVSVADYDDSRHFFLGSFFRDHYDEAMKTLPYIRSGVQVGRIEVWITNKRGRYDQARTIIAFSDLGEAQKIHNASIQSQSQGVDIAQNGANDLYQKLLSDPSLRKINSLEALKSLGLRAGLDYDKIEAARKLEEREYQLNKQLGYLSLRVKLQPDEVLAVAYEYTYNGKNYKVGEFSSDRPEDASGNLYLKQLKGADMSPSAPYWDYMMRNVYRLSRSAYGVEADGFRFDVMYRSDQTGAYMPYLPSGKKKGIRLLNLLGLDRLDRKNERYSDGRFDFVAGYTILPNEGLIIFPTVEPFGATLKDLGVVDKYVYSELYDQSLIQAKQIAEKNKYLLKGEFKGSGSGLINLGSINVSPGSVVVRAGGQTLVENVDYTVDYMSGTVKIINEQLKSAHTPIDVSLEDNGGFGMQRKTMLGIDLAYAFSKDFTLGLTAMYLSEMPLTNKTAIGSESMRNFLWGSNLSYRGHSRKLTSFLNNIPFLDLNQDCQFNLDAEFAHLMPGHYKSRYNDGRSYLDDFESSRSEIDLMGVHYWSLASLPETLIKTYNYGANNLEYGYDRAKLSWFNIDPIFTRERSSLTPSYIRNNPELVSNHFVREVLMRELFPYRDQNPSQQSYIYTLNLRYQPQVLGAYNLNLDRLQPDGLLAQGERSWAGIMRKLDQTDFESSNIEYLEFWLMDPFVYNPQAEGGDLYIDLGDISEDILHDGQKFYENGLPFNKLENVVEDGVWGKMPKRQSVGYAFDNAKGAREKQDVGYNGLSTAEERTYPAYKSFLQGLRQKLTPSVLSRWRDDPFSPLNDPAGDDFHHFRDEAYDNQRTPILDRYLHYNGTEGNSSEAKNQEKYSMASRLSPDVEDVNLDNNLNLINRYFEYKISIRPKDMQVGQNFIVGSRLAQVTLRNGKNTEVRWYQFKVPIRQYSAVVGGISDFRSMRFMRLFLTKFAHEVNLRFGALRLVRGDWREYLRSLDSKLLPSNAKLSLSAVNIEEHGDRDPINYILPPGVSRSLDAQETQSIQQNEQSLSMKVQGLAPTEAKAIYKNTSYDLRRYQNLQLFVHAEDLVEDLTNTADGDISLFLRLGSDYRSNYYEYAVPLKISKAGRYSDQSENDRRRVWPEENFLDIKLDDLVRVKRERNKAMSGTKAGKVTPFNVFSRPDPSKTKNAISVLGNPSLSNVRTIMIGVRNNSGEIKSVEVWVNELRLGDYHEEGGWAANTNFGFRLAELGSFNFRGQYSTAGFGAIDQALAQRQLDDRLGLNLSTNINFGTLLPKVARLSLPFYYSLSDEETRPQYNPNDEDMLLSEALSSTSNKSQADSILNYAVRRRRVQSISLNNVNLGIRSKNPMPYDPANISLSYSHNQTKEQSPEIQYRTQMQWQLGLNYNYTPTFLPLRPFKWLDGEGSFVKFLREFGLTLWPNRLSLQTSLMRSYEEEQIRNRMEQVNTSALPVSFSQQFLWYRKLNLSWSPLRSLVFNLNTGTDARIEEPHVQVNKALNPDDYAVWKDEVQRSIRELGTPMRYNQKASLVYTLPTQSITALNWLTAQANYSSSYSWSLGAMLPKDGKKLPNRIANQMNLNASLQMNLRSLYNKSSYLSKLIARVDKQSHRQKQKKTKPKVFKKKVQLYPDSLIRINHGMLSDRLIISTKDTLGRVCRIKPSRITKKFIEFKSKDSLSLNLSIRLKPESKMGDFMQAVVDRSLYTLLMVKNFSVSYRNTSSSIISGFLPNAGSAFGQGHSDLGLSPGLAFAFGLNDEGFVQDALGKGWLINSPTYSQPAVFSSTRVCDIKATLKPIKDLNISLTFNYTDNRRNEHFYMFDGSPVRPGGDFMMTTVGLRSFFSMPSGENAYKDASFDRLLASREQLVLRLRNKMLGRSYPSSAMLGGNHWSGKTLDGQNLLIDQNSSAVLIPAFRSAYAIGSDASSVALSPLPSIFSMLPNWNISYTGLSHLPYLKDWFQSISLKHAYRGVYRIDNYGSYPSWVSVGDKDFGVLVPQTTSERPRLSLPYDIASISLQESFFPLIGVDINFKNGLTISSQWRRSRAMTLNLSAFRMIETRNNEINASLSYRIADVMSLFKPKKKSRGRRRNNQNSQAKGLSLRLDYSYGHSISLMRSLQDYHAQASSGTQDSRLSFSAEYELSRMVSLRAYYEWIQNYPLVSTSAFPMSNTAYGVNIRFNLMQ